MADLPGAPASEPAASATPRADRIAQEQAQKDKRGMIFMLALGETAALGGCWLAWSHVTQGVELAEQFGRELAPLANVCDVLALPAFGFPPVVAALAIVLTRAGKVQQRAGVMLAIILFFFALLWPAVAMAAFMDEFSPPRSQQSRLQGYKPRSAS
jgi:hypothetical protein